MDIALHAKEYGQGEPLILLHGNGENTDYFEKQINAFAAHYHVIALDTRGHGLSPRGRMPFTLSQFAEDLHGFMTTRGIAKAHILGFSDGGNIALLFALKYPEKVGRLVLNGANLCPGGVKKTFQVPIQTGYGLVSLISLFHKKAIAKKELLGLMVKEPNIRPEDLSVLNMPVLVIAGTHDMIKEAHTRQIAASLPYAKLCILEGDHFIAAKSSDKFNEAVLEFLQS